MEVDQLTIKETLEGFRKKQFSLMELLKSYYEKTKKVNSELNAFLTIKEFGPIVENGPLLGIPVALKDIYITEEMRTTAGSKVLSNYIPSYNATVVDRLFKSGVVIVGKTNLDAWAHGSSGENSDFGPAKNPWNLDFVPGGSSSGSAVAVAAGLCLAATGTDTGGSIRLPASFCNIVGLKPTYGRVSRYGIIAMASSLDSIGHFTKTVFDSALILNITAGYDRYDATTVNVTVPDYTKNIQKGIKGIKVGIPKEYFSVGIEPQVKELVINALKKMETLGAIITEVTLPHTEYALAVYYIIQPAEVSSNLARYDGIRYGNDRSFFGPEARRRIILGTYTLSAGYYDAYYLKAMKVRTLLREDFNNAFDKVDVLIAPVSPTLPFKLGEKTNDPLSMYLSDVYTVTMNLVGVPSLAIPCGFAHGLPVGLQIIGPHFSEELLFQVGHAYQQVTDWHKRRPNLDS
ncbi:Asp-tRNA(Asn)/Glu-tRNA(Gln) amidotransferase subunit GatA [Candidatus Gottesmanbacteria bacterium]|nr:Asp-tRNA(Asn)/Glu-tRNA(Gln) amidotransferase subunit GatA [Candidatus Gottesmanbacteria bacterium]